MTAAFWCVLIAGLMPYFTVAAAKAGGRYDNHNPRDWAAKTEGFRKRAYAAHQNHFEAFPLFAAAVLIADLKGGPRLSVDILAIIFIAARLGYTICYIRDLPNLRSLFWFIGIATVVAILTSPAWI